MDLLDIKILDALQKDGAVTKAELADQVGSTPSTCIRRANRLIKNGYLERNVYLASPAKPERGIMAIISVVTSHHRMAEWEIFAKNIRDEISIVSAYGTTGEVDVVLQGYFSSMEEYQKVCDRLFGQSSYVVRYTTFFAVECYKNTTEISSDELKRRLQDT